MKIRRAREEKNFTILANAFIDDRQLSVLACGLGTIFLRMPPEAEISLEKIAEHRKEGIKSLRAAARELEHAGYLLRIIERAAGGQLVTCCEMHSRPVPESERPESLPKPWSKARQRGQETPDESTQEGSEEPTGETTSDDEPPATGEDVSAGHTESPSRKVGVGKFGTPNIGTPTFKDKDFGDKDFLDNPPSTVPQQPDGDEQSAREVEEAGDGTTKAARELVSTLPEPWRFGPKAVERLTPLAAAALRRGWDPDQLAERVVRNPDGVKHPESCLKSRLEDLPDPPVKSSSSRSTSSRPAHCGECDPAIRQILDEERGYPVRLCPNCHPSKVSA